jgi:AcrR family transcriptional regulator
MQAFTEQGYEATTMEQVRAVSGASIGSIYHHFRNKEELASALYLAGYEDFCAATVATLEGATSPEAGIRAVAVRPLRWSRRNVHRARFMHDRSSVHVLRAAQSQLEEVMGGMLEGIGSWAAPLIDQQVLRPYSAPTFFALWCGPSVDYVRRWLYEGPWWEPNLDEAQQAFADAAWAVSRA